MAAMTSGVYAILSIWKTMKMVKYFYFFFWNFNESLGLFRYKTKGENVIKTRTFFFFHLEHSKCDLFSDWEKILGINI